MINVVVVNVFVIVDYDVNNVILVLVATAAAAAAGFYFFRRLLSRMQLVGRRQKDSAASKKIYLFQTAAQRSEGQDAKWPYIEQKHTKSMFVTRHLSLPATSTVGVQVPITKNFTRLHFNQWQQEITRFLFLLLQKSALETQEATSSKKRTSPRSSFLRWAV